MKTVGEQRVRVDFNVAGSNIVDLIKRKSAELIDECENLKTFTSVPERSFKFVGDKVPIKQVLTNNPEQLRLISLAQSAYEEAAMWAVKAVTYKSE